MTITIKFLILLGIFALFIIIVYNSLVRKRNMAANSFATIDVMLKKRFDLIPNLVATVKKYASHEQEVFTEITRLRAMNYDSFSESEKETFDSAFTQAANQLVIIGENYPNLKASDNFMQLQRSINETEEQLAAARRTYNAAVTDYNNSVQSFPSNMVATLFGFKDRDLFRIPELEKTAPDVKEILNY